jgi:chemotaxis protein histidine kinase CheA
LAFTAADVFGSMLVAYRQQGPMPETGVLESMVRSLANSAAPQAEAKAKSHDDVVTVSWTEYEQRSAEHAQSEGRKVFHVVAYVDPLCAMPIAARQLVTNALASVARILGARPENVAAAAKVKQLDLLISTGHPESEIVKKVHIPTVIQRVECFEVKASAKAEAAVLESHPANSPSAALKTSEPDAQETAISQPASAENILRVDAGRIDNVLNLVGELIIAKLKPEGYQEISRTKLIEFAEAHQQLRLGAVALRGQRVERLERKLARFPGAS